MTLDQMQYFCMAAQLGNFSKAAEMVHISQPSLCIAIRFAYTASLSKVYIPRLLKTFLENEGKDCSIYSDEMPMIGYRKDFPMSRQLNSLYEQLGVEPNIIHFAYSEDAISRLVEQGLGIAIIAEIEGLERYNIRRCFPDWLSGGRYIYLMRHRTRLITHAAQQLQNHILHEKENVGTEH